MRKRRCEYCESIWRIRFLYRISVGVMVFHPNLFYKWKEDLFESALETFSGKHKNGKSALERKNEQFSNKITDMREVIAWLTEENLKLRKNEFGEI